ncbi:MAG: DUF3179 domain-containing protein [Solirubrobacterales bacterium]
MRTGALGHALNGLRLPAEQNQTPGGGVQLDMSWTLIAAALAAVVMAGCGGADDEPPEAGRDAVAEAEIPFDTSDWRTDFSEHSVRLDEFLGGGPPKDGIPSIDEPKLVSVADADEFLAPREPVAVVELDGAVRAYPIQILTWHEIVNHEIAGDPVAVTYCPLCNSTVAFRREVEGQAVEFGTTGMLRNSDLVMYDRRTESWWQQITAEAVVGELTGTKLDVLPSQILSWRQVQRLHPEAEVLSRDTGFDREYGSNPYPAYDRDPDSAPFLFEGEPDRSLPPKERVAAIQAGGRSAVVYPFSRLADDTPVNDELDGRPIVVLYDPDVASALDSPLVSAGDNAGAAAVFERAAGGRTLTFEPGAEAGEFRDRETGSTWGMTGRAIGGPLAGARLEQIAHDDQFWFALAAFFEDAEIRR